MKRTTFEILIQTLNTPRNTTLTILPLLVPYREDNIYIYILPQTNKLTCNMQYRSYTTVLCIACDTLT